jgi:hypothetical protein
MMNKLDEVFLDYLSYLAFMAAQLPWGYGPFSLIKAIDKILVLQELSDEIGFDNLCTKLREEFKMVEGTPSSDVDTWGGFLERVTDIITEELMKDR